MQIGKFYTVKRNYGHERDVSLLHHLTDRLLGTENHVIAKEGNFNNADFPEPEPEIKFSQKPEPEQEP